MTCFECAKEIEHYPCACGYKPISYTPAQKPIHCYEPLHDGPYVSMDEALADQPEQLAKLKRILTA